MCGKPGPELSPKTNTRRRDEPASGYCLRVIASVAAGSGLDEQAPVQRSARFEFAVTVDGDSRRNPRARVNLTLVELARKPPSGRPNGTATLNHPQGKGCEEDVGAKRHLQRPTQTALLTSRQPAYVQASLEMARLGIEPRTPRFSVVCSTN